MTLTLAKAAETLGVCPVRVRQYMTTGLPFGRDCRGKLCFDPKAIKAWHKGYKKTLPAWRTI